MKNIFNKNLLIWYLLLNIFAILIYTSIAKINVSLIAGYFAGLFAVIFIVLMFLIIRKSLYKKNLEKQIKTTKTILILFIVLINILKFGIISIFIGLNYYIKNHYSLDTNIGLYPFNMITFTTPYLLFLISVVFVVIQEHIYKSNYQKGLYG
ncbi:Uncharacterised protein [Metamycoplasma cloacale]|uniref:Uncharacterized protein n=1 Tax=Metamycoplasma cloacale TaxID=92401 RepID=A0A2Z4LLN4_9BACT|nr:hypothetical protein [Metamycoplasma cloacale]AWX42691.1 hypothetical protein DK849_01200 [Metamycoplasma cloacale]VEU79497.1 Uncharacterised protein [Metamycoplasma cloacale]